MICGFHEYKVVWYNPLVGEDLLSKYEVGNPHDTHVPIKIIDGNLTLLGNILQRISLYL